MADEIKYLEELEPFMDQFQNLRLRGVELISSSPFREDTSPSFSLNLETGLWIDFGSVDDLWGKGNFIKLMAFLSGEHYEDVLERYKQYSITRLSDIDKFELNIKLDLPEEYRTFNLKDFDYWSMKSNYLNNRGITDKAQKAFQIGYDHGNKAVAFPYHDTNGKVINIKFRKVSRKQFYYLPDGQAIGNHVYGLHMIKRAKATKAFIVESEIDCLYLWSYGIPAVAMGSANMSRRQEELLDLSPLTELVLAFDNDPAGRRATLNAQNRLSGKYRLQKLQFPKNCKDINDIPKNILKRQGLCLFDIPLMVSLST